jgi:hypothetical protein
MRKRKIVDLYDVRAQAGDVGIEIEMEGVGLAMLTEHGMGKHGADWPWQYKADGSLRGESCEWVLNRPVAKDKVNTVLSMLWESKDALRGARFNPSRRCGVHIHMNVQDLTELQVFNLIGTYLAFENLMVRWAGEDRQGNLFCLRASDARELIDALVQAKQAGNLNVAMTDQIRYASVNINSIGRYGSLEFRALGTPAEPQKISQWVRMLYCIRDLSLEFKSLRDLLYTLSASNAKEMIARTFGPRSVLRNIEGKEEMLRDGMRNVQDLLITHASHMRNQMYFPGPGWHVFDPNDPQAMARWQQRQEQERRLLQPGRLRLAPADPDEPVDWDFGEEPEEREHDMDMEEP